MSLTERPEQLAGGLPRFLIPSTWKPESAPSFVEYNGKCWQLDRTVAPRAFGRGERKVRTPESSVPDNVREAAFKRD
jgi:hypothetical protein